MNKIKSAIYRFTDAFEAITVFVSIRRALTALIPIIVIGALSLMLSSLPIPAYQQFITNVFGGRILLFLSIIYQSTFGMLSIYMTFALSYKYASTFMDNSKEMLIVSVVSLTVFFCLSTDMSESETASSYGPDLFFSAIACALITCALYRLLKPKMSGAFSNYALNSDRGFTTAVQCLIPGFIIILVLTTINFVISQTFHVNGIQGLFSYLCRFIFSFTGSSLVNMLIYVILVQLMWFFGIHGNNILYPTLLSDYSESGNQVFSMSYYGTFVNIGGSGVILCVVIAALIVAKTKEIKYITKIGVLPALFNISEIISIGLPILFNPIFFIPFLIVPIISSLIAYSAMCMGLVPMVLNDVEWTTPVFFSGYYATGSFSGVLLQLVILIVGVLIYIPFVKMYEERLVADAKNRVSKLVEYMEECEQSQKSPDLLKLNDSLGQTAHVLANELADAIENGEIFLMYQPQTDTNEQCIGCEALVRWEHPLVGRIYPPLVVQLAIESGYLESIDRLLVKNACELIHEIETECNQSVKVSINMTVASFLRDGFEEMFSNGLYRYGINPSSLCIELTENEAYTSDEIVSQKIKNLQSRGHKLIIDDFGMGHTSLKYLQANRFDIVKLDGSLTKDIENNPVNKKIIRSICELGTSLGFDVIAEYVEEEQQKNILSDLGCSYYQGYFYSQALSKEAFIKYYKSNNFFIPFNEK